MGDVVFIATPQFPSVPDLPGVPQLARAPAYLLAQANVAADQILANTTAILANSTAFLANFEGALPPVLLPQVGQVLDSWTPLQGEVQWGVFDAQGNLAINADACYGFDDRKGYAVTEAIVQSGAFTSYNKVEMSRENSVLLVKSSSQAERTQFLAEVDAVLASLDMFTIVTPEQQYLNCNCVRRENSRKDASNAFYLEVELFFVEIRESTAQYESTAANTQNATNPNAQSTIAVGSVMPTTSTTAQAAGAADAVAQSPM